MREIIVDSFAGGGGASIGIEMALGCSPDIAINHDAVALAMHAANHPKTKHLPANVWKVDPVEATGGRPVGLLWASPDCKHFSKAKGGKPVEKRIRDLAWVIVHWAWQVKPRIIILENVEEFATWGPLADDGRPCPARKGETFRKWVNELRGLGYVVDWRELRACDYGAPTIRKRLFLIARRDGKPIVWPAPTHGDPKSEAVKAGELKAWRAAAEIINWSLPCPSIFLSRDEVKALWVAHRIRVQRPLKPKTMERIAKGVFRYVINAAEPFIVPITHGGDFRVNGIGEPLRTQTTAHRGEHALVTPFLVPRYGERPTQEPRTRSIEEPMPVIVPTANEASLIAPHLMTMRNAQKPHNGADEPAHTITAGGAGLALVAGHLSAFYGEGQGGKDRSASAEEPLRTITCDPRHAAVTAFLAQHNYLEPGHDAREPLSTIVAKGSTQAVVSAGLMNLKGTDRRASDIEAPISAITAQGKHLAEVRAFLMKYYSSGGQHGDCRNPMPTDTTEDRIGLVTVQGEVYRIVDIGMRMLTARERFDAQGFPPGYIITLDVPRLDKCTGATVMAPITGDQQGRMVGNSVSPVMAEALVRANFSPRDVRRSAQDQKLAPQIAAGASNGIPATEMPA